jgi:mRNA interferase RelE/StbE
MAQYSLQLLRQAEKFLAALENQPAERIKTAIDRLTTNPRPPGCEKMQGEPGWRIRVGKYRIVYEIIDERLVVLVVRIGHRREVYK